MIRVLWFTGGPLPAVMRRLGYPNGGTGHWMSSLLEHVAATPDVKVGVVTAIPGFPDLRFEEGGVDYYLLHQPRLQPIFSGTKNDLARCADIVAEWRPDLIHVHGSERFFGLLGARRMVSVPMVISLQGFLGPYIDNYFGALSWKDVIRAERVTELATRRGLLWRYWQFRAGAGQELEILRNGNAFMGRTAWDRAYLASLNPAAKYCHTGELLRPPLYDITWDLAECDRHTLFFTNAGEPRRGIEVLLEALSIVRRAAPDARLRLAGHVGGLDGYRAFLRRRAGELGVADAVDYLGYLDVNGLAQQLRRAHLFTIASYSENSPNSLCEAMLAGLPSVAAYAGGMPSLVQHGMTGCLFPPGDAPLLADTILRLFQDDDFATRLGRAAKLVASERHAPKRVLSELFSAYEMTLREARKNAAACRVAAASAAWAEASR